jgi:hypothetical protein
MTAIPEFSDSHTCEQSTPTTGSTKVTEEEGEDFNEVRRVELIMGRSTRIHCSGGTCLLARFHGVILS